MQNRSSRALLLFLVLSACGGKAVDVDGDGYAADDDCDDADAAVHPGAAEVCDGQDNDCDGLVDDDDDNVDAASFDTFYRDVDGDRYGTLDDTVQACTAPTGYTAQAGDCDDTDADLSPETGWHADADRDGYGSPKIAVTSCEPPGGYTADDTDCDDTSAAISPAATEICDEIDNDCDGNIDDADGDVDPSGYLVWYRDADGDGYGTADVTTAACAPPSGYTDNTEDCADDDAAVSPTAKEICGDGLDNDCSGDAPTCILSSGPLTAADADALITGDTAGDAVGRSLTRVDLDGDGIDELVLGGHGSDDGGTDAGTVYLWSGITSGSAGASAAASWVGTASQGVGSAVGTAGDVDGDGYEDLLAGGYTASASRGVAYLMYGGVTLSSTLGDDITTWDAAFAGASAGDALGHWLGGLGDINGDGIDDFGLGAYGDDDGGSDSGSLFIWYGATTALAGDLDAVDADDQVYGTTGAYVGYQNSFDGVGDLDGDGIGDLVVGGVYGGSGAGAAHVFYGSTAGISGTTTGADASITGTATGASYGRSVFGAGDVDNDGYDDFLVDEVSGGGRAGVAYLYRGGATRMTGTAVAASWAWATFTGGSSFAQLGQAMDARDINGDGKVDALIGEGGSGTGFSFTGAAYLYYGPLSSGAYTTALADVTIEGDESTAFLGHYGVVLGELDGDGYGEVIVGAYAANSAAGEILIFQGTGM